MREHRRLTTLWAFAACYRNSITFFLNREHIHNYRIRPTTANSEKDRHECESQRWALFEAHNIRNWLHSLSHPVVFGYTVVRIVSKHSRYRPRESISETLEYKSGILATKPHHVILTEVVYMELIVLFSCFNRLANYNVIATHVVYLKLLLHQKYLYVWGNEDKVPRTFSHRSLYTTGKFLLEGKKPLY
jgi:hypothetical protein